MKTIIGFLAIFFLFSYAKLFAQFSLDSLKMELDKQYTIDTLVHNDGKGQFLDYLNKDSLRVARLVVDMSGNIKMGSGPTGNAFFTWAYDEEKRCIEYRQYNIHGALQWGTAPPIMKYYYDDQDRKVRSDYFENDDRPCEHHARYEEEFNEEGEVIEIRRYDYKGRYELSIATRYEYQNGGTVVIKSEYDKDSTLVMKNNVAFTRHEYLTNKRKVIIESRFLDKHMNLVMTKEKFDRFEYAVIRYTYYKNWEEAPDNINWYGNEEQWARLRERGKKMVYLDTNMNFIGEVWGSRTRN